MRRLVDYKSFLQNGQNNMRNRSKIVSEKSLYDFVSMVEEGKKTDLFTLHLTKNRSVNESFGRILENKELMESVKDDSCKMLIVDNLKNLKEDILEKLERGGSSRKELIMVRENLDTILINEALDKIMSWVKNKADEVGVKVGQAKEVLKKVYREFSDETKILWDEIWNDVFKPGIDSLKNFAVKVFGEKVVARVTISAKYTMKTLDEYMKGSKSIWDDIYKGLESLGQKLVEVCKSIGETIRKIGARIFQMLKNFGTKLLNKVKDQLVGFKDIENKVDATKLDKEISLIIQDSKALFVNNVSIFDSKSTREMISSSGQKLLGTEGGQSEGGGSQGQSQGQVQSQSQEKTQGQSQGQSGSEEKKNESWIQDDLIWYSMIGAMKTDSKFTAESLINLSNRRDLRVFEAEEGQSGEIEKDVHKKNSGGIKKWLMTIVQWVLSPFSMLMEKIGEVVGQGFCAIPKWLTFGMGDRFEALKSGKFSSYAKSFIAVPTILALLAGAASKAQAWKFADIPYIGDFYDFYEKKKGELIGVQKEHVNYSNLNEATGGDVSTSGGSKGGFNWESVAITTSSALLGFLVGAIVKLCPPLNKSFKVISLTLFLMTAIGFFLFETETGKKLSAKMNEKVKSGLEKMYHVLHPH